MRHLIDSFNIFPKLVLCCIVTAAALFLSCEKDDKYDYRVIGPDENEKQLDILLVSGNRQTGVVDQPLADSLVVYVSENHLAKPSWTVNFKIIQGEGTLSPTSNATDANGFTATTLTPTGLPGQIQVEATPFYGEKSVVFIATSVGE
jgi:hypothetical protein